MPNPEFPRIEGALRAVEDLAGRLAPGDVEQNVLLSLARVREAFTGRAAVEPAVDGLLQTLRGLKATGSVGRHGTIQLGRRPALPDELPPAGRVLEAVEEQLLPALRRVGFHV